MRLMELDPNKRLTARQCLHHAWLTRNCPPGYIPHLRKINEHVLRAEFAALGMEMPANIRTMPRRTASLRRGHPLASLAILPPVDPQAGPQGATALKVQQAAIQQAEFQQLQYQHLQAHLQQQQQQLQQAQHSAQPEETATPVSPDIVIPIGTDSTVGDLPPPLPGHEDDYDPYEFLINLEDDNEADMTDPSATDTFKRGILHIASEAQPTEQGPNLLMDAEPQPETTKTDSRGRWETLKRAMARDSDGLEDGFVLDISDSEDQDMEPVGAV